MIYFFRAENADVIDTYADNEIWRWDFEIEPERTDLPHKTESIIFLC